MNKRRVHLFAGAVLALATAGEEVHTSFVHRGS